MGQIKARLAAALLALTFCAPLPAQDAPSSYPGSSVQQPQKEKKKGKLRTFLRAATCRGEVLDWQFCAALAWHFIGANRDARSTRALHQVCLSCVEGNSWLYGKRPSMKRMTLTHLGLVAGFGTASYYIKAGFWHTTEVGNWNYAERRLWWLWAAPQGVLGTAHWATANGNYHFRDAIVANPRCSEVPPGWTGQCSPR